MATGSRTLTLKLLADIDNFTSGLDKGTKATKSTTDQISDFGKKAALAFAAVGAAALAYAKQAVEAAAADEAAQIKLAATIEATTNASKGQIAEVEKYITKTSIAIGVTDDDLRPAFDRLVRSTGNLTEAQKLLNLALDLQAVTGKPLETVVTTLGKAYDGNTAALAKLGLGLDASSLKGREFSDVAAELDAKWGNFAEETANSTQKGLERVKIALGEANEAIGAALLPTVQKLTAWLMEHFVPALQATIGGLTGDKSILQGLNGTYEAFYKWGERIRQVINTVIDLKDEILIVAGIMATMFVVSKISAGVMATIGFIKLLIAAYNALKASAFIAGIAGAFALNPALGVAAGVAGMALIAGATKYINGLDTGGNFEAPDYGLGNPNLKTSSTPSGGGGGGGGGISIPSVSGSLATAGASAAKVTAPINLAEQTNKLLTAAVASASPNMGINTKQGVLNKLGEFATKSGYTAGERDFAPIVVNVSGAIDPEGTARTIVNTLNNSFYRGTGGAGGLVT